VQSAVGDPLARALLAGEVRDGDTVRVDVSPAADALTVTPTQSSPPGA
jgi:ATP-dependent Clp protease ATP-binding subunit ClpB